MISSSLDCVCVSVLNISEFGPLLCTLLIFRTLQILHSWIFEGFYVELTFAVFASCIWFRVRLKAEVMKFTLVNTCWPFRQHLLTLRLAEECQKRQKTAFLARIRCTDGILRARARIEARGKLKIRKVWCIWMQNALWMISFEDELENLRTKEIGFKKWIFLKIHGSKQ